jgi:hypothetical protein
MITLKSIFGLIFYIFILTIGITFIIKNIKTQFAYYKLIRLILIVLWIALNYYLYWSDFFIRITTSSTKDISFVGSMFSKGYAFLIIYKTTSSKL